MIPYEDLMKNILSKYNRLIRTSDWPIATVLRDSIDPYYSSIEYEMANSLIPHIQNGANIAILGSWFSITFLETFSLIKQKINSIQLFDYDKTVSMVGKDISDMIDMNIRYSRKNVIFDDISNDISNCNIFIVPYINMLLPFDELAPNALEGSLVSLAGSNDAFLMRYGNPIFNIDDLRQQTKFTDELYASEKGMRFKDRKLSFKISILTVKI